MRPVGVGAKHPERGYQAGLDFRLLEDRVARQKIINDVSDDVRAGRHLLVVASWREFELKRKVALVVSAALDSLSFTEKAAVANGMGIEVVGERCSSDATLPPALHKRCTVRQLGVPPNRASEPHLEVCCRRLES